MTSLGLKPDEMLSEGQDMRECVRASGGRGGACSKMEGVTVGTGAELVSFTLCGAIAKPAAFLTVSPSPLTSSWSKQYFAQAQVLHLQLLTMLL